MVNMNIAILNASNPKRIDLEADEYLDLRDRESCFDGDQIINQCRSWHSWAYSLETEFFVYKKQGWPGIYKYKNIIMLVNRDIDEVIPLVDKLKKSGKNVAIAYHEGVEDLLYDPNKIINLKKLVDQAGKFINFIGQYEEFFRSLFSSSSIYHVDHTNPFDWFPSYKTKWQDKPRDILIGTRTLNNHLSRNTLVPIVLASQYKRENPELKIDWICEQPVPIVKDYLNKIGVDNITIFQGPFEYNRWLKFINNYKYIIHHDLSMNLGQISLDALMVDSVPCGGTTWINQMLETDDEGRSSYILEEPKYGVEGTDKGYIDLVYDLKKYILHPNRIKENLIEVFK